MRIWKGYQHGINFGGWFSQKEHTEKHYQTFITEADFATVARWGLDHVRIPVDYELVESEGGILKEDGFRWIKQCILWCRKYDLHMILSLHKTAGYSFADESDSGEFFTNLALQARFISLWQEFAKRFGNDSDVVAFELLNEAADMHTAKDWNQIAANAIAAIRSVAPDVFILAGGIHYNGADGVTLLDAPADSRIVYSFHCYDPIIFTHQTAQWIKGMPKVCHQFHLALQSGSDTVLARMHRRYTSGEFLDACAMLREAFEDCALTTDVMTGFPGETEAEFAQTKDTCTRAGFARMHVFPYSEREGTKAALMPDSVPRHIREERARELIALGRELEKKALEARIGREEDVLVEEIDGQGNGAGYTGGYMRVCVRGGKPGEIARVRITGTDGEELTGEIIENEKGEIHMSDCLFCKIAAGEIPSTKVYEDETTLAFRDIAPQAPVHVLVIPKKHVSGWYDAQGESDETLAHLMRVAAQVAKSEGIVESGFRVVSNCGDDAQQTVKHLHLHVLGGKKMDGRMA